MYPATFEPDPNAITVWESDNGRWHIEQREHFHGPTFVVVDHRKNTPFITRFLPARDTLEDPRVPAYIRSKAQGFTERTA